MGRVSASRSSRRLSTVTPGASRSTHAVKAAGLGSAFAFQRPGRCHKKQAPPSGGALDCYVGRRLVGRMPVSYRCNRAVRSVTLVSVRVGVTPGAVLIVVVVTPVSVAAVHVAWCIVRTRVD